MATLIQPALSAVHGPLTRYIGFALLVVAVYVVVVKRIYHLITSPLRSVPGPFLARFTRLWELYAMRKHDFANYNIALHKKYGPIVRLGPNRYSIDDTDATKLILGYQNPLDKSRYYVPFNSPTESNTFGVQSIAEHAKIRRPIASLFSNTNLLSYEPFVDTCNSILLKRLVNYARQGKAIDVRAVMQYYAFDVIGEITVGSRFGFMEDDGDKLGILDPIDGVNKVGAILGIVPELFMPLVRVGDFFKVDPGFGKIRDFINKHLRDRASGRTKSPSDREDFLNKMLALEQDGKATRFDTYNLCAGAIIAGSDTTAISLAAAIGYLSMNPRVKERLRRELDDAADTLSDPVTFNEAQKLPYLQAVIKETIRVHPAIGAPMARVIGPNGANIAGYHFPAGTEVGVNAWVVHHNQDIFGPDAAQFNPERWLIDDAEKRSLMDRNMLAFGAGPRVCLGKNVSLLEMYKVIPQIVRRFDFEIVADGAGNGYAWKTYWFTKQDFKCLVKERSA